MSDLRVESYEMPSADLGPKNPLPPLDGPLPYRLQDNYNRDRKLRSFKVAVLENETIKATFLLELGGRLWSLFHKPTARELLYVNPVFQPCNLAIRNAWFSGGVEWNIGIQGHSVHTCSPMFAARVEGREHLVLRIYEWERLRMVPYQIDAFLPDGSEFLFVRVRITNPHDHPIPMYWWSNIAVPELDNGRVLAPADRIYRHDYSGAMSLVPFPIINGIDQSYPTNFMHSADCFFHIEDRQPWITALDENGYGLIQTSTGLLKGRKLFVWGMGVGGRHWQEFLSVPGSRYIEIQAGLARTQSEYVPMPGNTQWEWVEAYGLMEADPSIVHGQDWTEAYEHVDKKIKAKMPMSLLQKLLAETEDVANRPPSELLHIGSGWGALENKRRTKFGQKSFCSQEMVFCDESIGEDQQPWLTLLNTGNFPTKEPLELPGAWMIQPDWQTLLERSDHRNNWFALLHLGVMYYSGGDFESAKYAWEKSVNLCPSPWAYRNLSVLAKRKGEIGPAVDMMLKALEMAPENRNILIECCETMVLAKRHSELLSLLKTIPETSKPGRLKVLEARSALEIGDLDRVETILMERPIVPDIREGEVSLSQLWFEMHEKRISSTENIPIDDILRERVRRDFPPPKWLDFRQAGS